ncbi:MAG: hypothetical protein ACOH2F_17355 [Cellulomonas sp.]
MKRLFWIGVGAAATVVVIRKVRGLVDAHTPPGVAQAAGVVSGLAGAVRSARSEFSAGLAEREAELRHDLLGDVDLDVARERADSWRADRHQRRESGRDRSWPASSDAQSRPGRHTGAGPTGEITTRPAASGELAQDPSDGELGYSFY